MNKSICIIQTGTGSQQKFMETSASVLPDVKAYQIIDDSLLPSIVKALSLTPAIKQRFLEYYKMADDLHVDAILHSCTLAASLVDYLRQFFATPIVRLDEGMARRAVAVGGKVVVFGSMQLSIDNHSALIHDIASKEGKSINITGHLLQNVKDTEATVAEIKAAAADANVVSLSQPSMDKLVPLIGNINATVLSPTQLGFEYLKEALIKY